MNKHWANTPAGLRLSPDYVDIWCIRLDLPDQVLSGFSDFLSADERTRAGKFASAQKSREFTITRGCLRKILAQILNQDPCSFNIGKETGGKPYLIGDGMSSRIRFSVSHSHDLALIAVTMDTDIGIDMEKVRADIDHENLSRRFFSSAEYQSLQHCSEATRLRAFFAAWTRKEAIVKATGEGIALGLKQFDVSVDPDGPAQLLATRWGEADVSAWFLKDIQTEPDYLACLAMQETDLTVRYWNPL